MNEGSNGNFARKNYRRACLFGTIHQSYLLFCAVFFFYGIEYALSSWRKNDRPLGM